MESDADAEAETAPADIQELFDMADDIPKNKAIIRFADGTYSDQIGPSKLEEAMKEAESADAVILNGPVTGKVLNYINQSSATTVIGTKEGKDFESPEGVNIWLVDIHR